MQDHKDCIFWSTQYPALTCKMKDWMTLRQDNEFTMSNMFDCRQSYCLTVDSRIGEIALNIQIGALVQYKTSIITM